MTPAPEEWLPVVILDGMNGVDPAQDEPKKKAGDVNMVYMQASRRRKGVARHRGESFAEMAMRHGVARRPAPAANATAEGRQ